MENSRTGLEMNRANRAPSSSKCNSLMHKNIRFGFNWCVASHLYSTQINSKSSKSHKFVCYEPLLKFPKHQFLCSVSVRGPRASRAPSMLGSFAGLNIEEGDFEMAPSALAKTFMPARKTAI